MESMKFLRGHPVEKLKMGPHIMPETYTHMHTEYQVLAKICHNSRTAEHRTPQ